MAGLELSMPTLAGASTKTAVAESATRKSSDGSARARAKARARALAKAQALSRKRPQAPVPTTTAPTTTTTVAPAVVTPTTAPTTTTSAPPVVTQDPPILIAEPPPTTTPTTTAPSTTTPTTAPPPTTTPTTAPPPTTTPTTAPAPPPSGPGMVGGLGFAEGSGVVGDSASDLARRLDGIAATGAKWMRIDFDWSGLEPTKGSFDWGYMDRIVSAAQARGIKVLAILAYTPAWARPAGTDTHYPPTNVADFANFARSTVDHYAGVVRTWEIWNEPNLSGFWKPAASPGAYTTLLNAAYDAIKARDPGATVLTGGTAPAPDGGGSYSPLTFLTGVYDAGARGHFDAVAHHPYNYPYDPLRPETNFNWNAFGGVTPKLRELMVARGDSAKRIWATEIGAPTTSWKHGIEMTPEWLADHITKAVAAWRAWDWTGPMFWYSYRDSGTDQADPEQIFGLVRRDFSPKSPALESFTAAAHS